MKKDIAWLKNEINELPLRFIGFSMLKQREEFTVSKDDVLELIDQLDEPEALTPEWIYEHTWDNDHIWKPFVYVDDLKNLLVPKQEEVEEGRVRLIVGFDGGTESYYATDIGDALVFLTDYDARFTVSKEPMIPKFVAKWISIHHEQFDLYPALKRLENNALSWEDVYEWYRKNTRKFVDAYLTGKYEVEEEQKYYVLNKELQPMLCKSAGMSKKIMESNTGLTINEKGLYKEQYQLTEQEIKGYDERYFAFAVKVEELEE